MNIRSGAAKFVLLRPAWSRYGTAMNVKQGIVILHSRADDVIPCGASEEPVMNSGLPATALMNRQ